MTSTDHILLALVFISWALSCYHAIAAHRKSPGASAFRPFWRNRYSPAGKQHLRLQVLWTVLTCLAAVGLIIGK